MVIAKLTLQLDGGSFFGLKSLKREISETWRFAKKIRKIFKKTPDKLRDFFVFQFTELILKKLNRTRNYQKIVQQLHENWKKIMIFSIFSIQKDKSGKKFLKDYYIGRILRQNAIEWNETHLGCNFFVVQNWQLLCKKLDCWMIEFLPYVKKGWKVKIDQSVCFPDLNPDILPVLGARATEPHGERYQVVNAFDGFLNADPHHCFVTARNSSEWAHFAIPLSRVILVELLSRNDEHSKWLPGGSNFKLWFEGNCFKNASLLATTHPNQNQINCNFPCINWCQNISFTANQMQGAVVEVCKNDGNCYSCGTASDPGGGKWAILSCPEGTKGNIVKVANSINILQICEIRIRGKGRMIIWRSFHRLVLHFHFKILSKLSFETTTMCALIRRLPF